MRSKIALSATGLAAVAIALSAGVAAPAHADSTSATFLGEAANRQVSYSPGGSHRPNFATIDKDGDKVADATVYCIEPNVQISSGVYSGAQKMGSYSLSSYKLVDSGRLAWVVANGFPRTSPQVASSILGVDISTASPDRVAMALEAATQSAIWHFSSGYNVASNFKYDTRLVAEARTISALFTKAYAYLVANAAPISTNLTVWDSKTGDAASQGLVEVPSGPVCGCDEKDPTKNILGS